MEKRKAAISVILNANHYDVAINHREHRASLVELGQRYGVAFPAARPLG